MSEYVLQVEDLTKSFSTVTVLNNVKFDVKKGEVHALVGENGAGKSTLMNVVSGVHPRDSGLIFLDGKEVSFSSPKEACIAGVGFVHQEMALCPHMSVAENVFMWNIPVRKCGLIDYKQLNQKTDELLERFGTNFSAKTRTGDLSVAQQQVVEIVRAISMNAKLIIFDEPTSSLTEMESENLFRFIKILRQSNVGIVYISHRMPEIFNICDRATILRDGKYIETVNIQEVTPDYIVSRMVGRNMEDYYPSKAEKPTGEVILRAEGLSGDGFNDVSFTLKKNEILGFSGLIGSGRTEVMLAMCGFVPYYQGEVWFYNKKLNSKMKSNEIIKEGLFYITEDRKKNGLFLNMSTRRNISVTVLDLFEKMGFLDNRKEAQISKKMIQEMDIRVASDLTIAKNMSGGNQQKTMIAKWLTANPKILIMDEPTRGIDVGSKSEIHHKLRKLCNEGIGVIVISSELPEVIGLCDRVIVMHEGRVTGEAVGLEINEEHLMMLAANKEGWEKS